MGLELIASALATKRGASAVCTGAGPRASRTRCRQTRFADRGSARCGTQPSLPQADSGAGLRSLVRGDPGQMLACKFLRRQVFDVLRDQVRGRLKFVNRLVQIVRFFELYATPEA